MQSKLSSRCMNCELKEVLPCAKGVKLFILVDLDNWGFEDLLAPQPDSAKTSNWLLKNANSIYLWCFYQNKKRDYVANTDVFDRLSQNQFFANNGNSVFETFSKLRHLRFSSCGFRKQATDLSILQTCQLLAPKLYMAVISGDRNLGTSCEQTKGVLVKSFACNNLKNFYGSIENLFAPKLALVSSQQPQQQQQQQTQPPAQQQQQKQQQTKSAKKSK